VVIYVIAVQMPPLLQTTANALIGKKLVGLGNITDMAVPRSSLSKSTTFDFRGFRRYVQYY